MATHFPSLLRKAGLRATRGRIALCELLEKAGEPQSAGELAARLKSKAMDQVTVYRTLETLTGKGITRRINLGHNHADYELAIKDDHHHIVCTNCGKIQDFEGCDFDGLIQAALRQSKSFAKVTQHSLELFGLCKNCARRATAASRVPPAR